MLNKFKLGHNAVEETKNICCTKGKGTIDQSTVTEWLMKFHSGCKNLDDQSRSNKPKSMNAEVMLQTIDAKPASSTWRVSGELVISQSSVVRHLHDFGKIIPSYGTVPHILPKYCKTFYSHKNFFLWTNVINLKY